jgi:hypothetical protein
MGVGVQSVALRAQRIVKFAAEPTYVGEKIKRQRLRSFDRLQMFRLDAGWSKHENAWHGRAGAPTLTVIESQAEKVGLEVPIPPYEIIRELQRSIEGLRQIDAEFHMPQIEFYASEIERLSKMLVR